MFRRWLVPLASFLSVLSLLAFRAAFAEEPPAKPVADGNATKAALNKYVRLERNEDGEPLSMQTAIISFAKPGQAEGEPTVDLIGAVHVGEKSYYDALNDAFSKYDVVLYELVAPPGTRLTKGAKARSSHPVGAVQNGMKGVLELEHQLEMIDYTKDNLVRADMSPDEFAKSMADRGESFWGMFFQMMGQGISQQAKWQAKGKSFDGDLLLALFDKNRAVKLKRIMAEQFEDLEGTMSAFNGKDGSTIITERNKVALKELANQLAAGKKHIAIFYGAGHLIDMEERLGTDFGLKRTGERWLTAWSMPNPATK